jgi:predicted 3-demethylubiquinone-9 3-methyltransferase (glyoxalase superfamily)
MQKITPFLWFDSNAEEAVHFYTSHFKNSSIGKFSRYDKAGAAASGRPEVR